MTIALQLISAASIQVFTTFTVRVRVQLYTYCTLDVYSNTSISLNKKTGSICYLHSVRVRVHVYVYMYSTFEGIFESTKVLSKVLRTLRCTRTLHYTYNYCTFVHDYIHIKR